MVSHLSKQIDLLADLSLPDRYERLREHLGSELANILVSPSEEELSAFEYVAQEIRTRDEGILLPLYGETGTGKTTLASNLWQWQPEQFTSTLEYDGPIEYDNLTRVVANYVDTLPANEYRTVPVNLDHRESSPPNEAELAAIKRFLRTKPAGLPTLLLWPETNRELAEQISARYIAIAGRTSIDLPLVVAGPSNSTWADIALNTLRLSNDVDSLESLGVDPRDYSVGAYPTVGEYLRQISRDFNRLLQDLRRTLLKPIRLAIVFASETPDPGVLSQITNSTHYGLLDAQSLVAVTPESEIGRWWTGRRGLLTRAIVQLNAHAFSLTPSTAISAIRNCGPVNHEVLDAAGVRRYGPAHAARDLGRSDLGKFLQGIAIDRFETRGTPAEDATAAYQLLAERGFNLGEDKNLNHIMAEAGRELLQRESVPVEDITSEKGLAFCGLIPDNAFYFSSHVTCVEFTWRKGEFLTSGNRSTVAQYILTKMQKYVQQLGWTAS